MKDNWQIAVLPGEETFKKSSLAEIVCGIDNLAIGLTSVICEADLCTSTAGDGTHRLV